MGSSVERFQNSQWQKLGSLSFSKTTVLELLDKGDTLDIGCGDGILLERLKERGIKGVGVDISSEALKICKERGLECSQADIADKLPFADGSFDNVILTDVLEHLFQPGETLKEVYRITRSHIFIAVPNFGSLPARVQILFGKVPENNTPRDGHVYWMTHAVVLSLLKSASFEIEKMEVNTFWEKVPVVGFVMKRLKNIFPSLLALSFVVKAKKI